MTFKTILFSIFFIFIIIFFTLIYNNNSVMITLPIKIDQITNNKLNLYNKSINFIKLVDTINPSKGAVRLSSYNIKTLNIDINRNEIVNIYSSIQSAKNNILYNYYMPDELNQYNNANLIVGQNVYDIDFKLHGTHSAHFSKNKKSFKVKLTKKNTELFDNMKSFNLVIPEELNTVSILANSYLTDLLNLPSPTIYPIILKINNVNQGLYYLEENLSKEFLEKNKYSSADVFKSNDEWNHQYHSNHMNPFQNLISNTEFKNFSKLSVGQKNKFKNLINAKNYEDLENLVNLSSFAKHQAISTLVFDYGHSRTGDNLKLIYDITTGKFNPFYRNENIIENISSSYSYIIDEGLVLAEPIFGIEHSKNDIFYKLTKNNNFRNLRNSFIFEILKNEDAILNYYNDLINYHKKLIYADNTHNKPARVIIREINQSFEKLKYNISFSKNYLNYSRVFLDIEKQNNNIFNLNINADSNNKISISRFLIKISDTKSEVNKKIIIKILHNNKILQKINVNHEQLNNFIDISNSFKNFNFILNLDSEMKPMPQNINFNIETNQNISIDDIMVEFKDNITNQKIDENNIYFSIENYLEKATKKNCDPFVETSSNIKLKKVGNNILLIPSGEYIVKEDLIFPVGCNIKIEKGTKILLYPDTSLLFRGDLDINGSKNKKVIFEKFNPKQNFGTIAILGNKNNNVNINNLLVNGGSESIMENVFFSGGLSIYNSNIVNITNSEIINSNRDDGVNIKNSFAMLFNNKFYNNKFDALDLDFVNGYVINNTFTNDNKNILINPINKQDIKDRIKYLKSNKEGDAIDLSGSNIIVYSNLIENFIDKGMSIGENTISYIINNNIKNNFSAIAVKDSSKAYLIENNISENSINLNMFIKKNFFKSPHVYFYTSNDFDNFTQKLELKNGIINKPLNFEKFVYKEYDKVLEILNKTYKFDNLKFKNTIKQINKIDDNIKWSSIN